MKKLYDPVRKTWVENYPEERVRQKLMDQMISSLGFSKSLIAVEKELDQLPHLKGKVLPSRRRRVDLLCFGQNIHPDYPLYPLLMVECKAHPLDQEAMEQIVGYNYYVRAYFLALANQEEVKTFWYDESKKKYDSVPYLLSFHQMMRAIAK